MNMKFNRVLKSIAAFSLLSILLFVSCSQSINKNTISLKGEWQFQTDPEDIGIEQNWYQSKLDDVIEFARFNER